MVRLGHREVKLLPPNHTAGEWRGQDWSHVPLHSFNSRRAQSCGLDHAHTPYATWHIYFKLINSSALPACPELVNSITCVQTKHILDSGIGWSGFKSWLSHFLAECLSCWRKGTPFYFHLPNGNDHGFHFVELLWAWKWVHVCKSLRMLTARVQISIYSFIHWSFSTLYVPGTVVKWWGDLWPLIFDRRMRDHTQ